MTPNQIKENLECYWEMPGVAQDAHLAVWHIDGKRLTHSRGAKRDLNLEQKHQAWLRRSRPKDWAYWGRFAAPSNPRAPLEAPEWYRERCEGMRNGKALIGGYNQLDEADLGTFPLVDIIESRVEADKIAAAAAILRRVGRERLADFAKRFGVDPRGLRLAAANDNWPAAARLFLRAAA